MDTIDPVSMRNSVKIWFVIIIRVREIRVNPEDRRTSDYKTRVYKHMRRSGEAFTGNFLAS